MKSLLTLVLFIFFLLFCFGHATAVPLFPGTGTDAGTKFEDDNLDYFFDSDQDGDEGYGIISSGDILRAALDFTDVIDLTTDPNTGYPLDRANDELVAITEIKLSTKPDGGDWTFVPIDEATPMISVYSGGSIDFDSAGDPTWTDAKNSVIDGEFLWSFSITDDPDTFWSFSPTDPNADAPSLVQNLGEETFVGNAQYALNQVGGVDVFNFWAPDITGPGGDGLVDLAGNAQLYGGNERENAFAVSDTDALVNPIPEPTTLLLFGTGLLGLAAFGRKKFMGKNQ